MINGRDSNSYKIIKGVKENAIKYLKHFYELLGLDPDLLNYMDNIKIELVKSLPSGGCAQYLPTINTIVVNIEYIDDIIEYIYKDFDNPKIVEKVKLDVELTLVHELIHSNRVVLKSNGLSNKNIDKVREMEKKKKIDGHDFFQYRLLLSNVLNKSYVSLFKRYIPFKVDLGGDNNTVIAYDRLEKKYLVFKDQFLNIDTNKDDDSIIKEIGIKLNNNINNYKINDEIDLFVDNNICIVSSFYSPYDKYGKLVLDSDFDDNTSYDELFKEKYSYAKEIMDYNTYGLEEFLTETISRIVIKARNEKTLNIKQLCESVKDNDYESGINVIAEMIKSTDTDIINWFMTSAYSAYYNDYFEWAFQNEYYSILKELSYLYRVEYLCSLLDDKEKFNNAKKSSFLKKVLNQK